MPYPIEVAPAAPRRLRKIHANERNKVTAAIDRLAHQPRPAGARALTGHPGLLRIRVGDYRVVYTVDDGKLVVVIVAAAHRRSIYRDI
jgi:mRNA interferase RelE/StbE